MRAVQKDPYQVLRDFLFAPIRFSGISETSSFWRRFRLTSLEEERVNAVLPYIHGLLLDVGCGRNTLVRNYVQKGGQAVGVDVYDYGAGALIVENSSKLPFPDRHFDTITFVASLNHIPYRALSLKEAVRLLKDDGHVLITMINPVIGFLVHKIYEYRARGLDFERGAKEGEVYGLWTSQVITLAERVRLQLLVHKRFDYALNHLYLFAEKPR